MTDAEVQRWRAVIRPMAVRYVRRWAGRQDQSPLVDDMEMAGWIALLTQGPTSPRARWEVQNAIQNGLSYWLWGVRRGKKVRRLITQVPLDTVVDTLSEEDAERFRLRYEVSLGGRPRKERNGRGIH